MDSVELFLERAKSSERKAQGIHCEEVVMSKAAFKKVHSAAPHLMRCIEERTDEHLTCVEFLIHSYDLTLF